MSGVEIGRPAADEFDAYYTGYVERVEGSDILAALEEQREETLALLRELGEGRAGYRYAPGKWSVKEVIGHLLDSERIFCARALAFARGEAQPLPGFEQDDYVVAGGFDARPLAGLVAEYEAVRASTLALFAGLPKFAWRRRGVANEVSFSVRAIAFIVAGHEAHHLTVLRERYLGKGTD